MFLFVLTLHFLLCAALVGLVLIQQGKGADMGAAFGAGSSNSLFGAGGATNLVVKVTTFVAIAFMVTSITLINLSSPESSLQTSIGGKNSNTGLEGSVMQQNTAAAAPESAAAPQAENANTGNVEKSVPVEVQTAPVTAQQSTEKNEDKPKENPVKK